MLPARDPASPRASGQAFFDAARLTVVRFEYVSTCVSPPLLGLTLRSALELPGIPQPTLLLERDTVELVYAPRLASSCRHPDGEAGEWLWRGLFPVAPDVALDPDWLFKLRLHEDRLLALPAPGPRGLSARLSGSPDTGPRRRWPYVMRRGALLFVVTSQLWLSPAWRSAGALAAGSSSGTTSGEAAPEGPPAAPAEENPVEPAPETTPKLPPGGGPEQTPEPSSEHPVETPTSIPPAPSPGTPSQPPVEGGTLQETVAHQGSAGASAATGPPPALASASPSISPGAGTSAAARLVPHAWSDAPAARYPRLRRSGTGSRRAGSLDERHDAAQRGHHEGLAAAPEPPAVPVAAPSGEAGAEGVAPGFAAVPPVLLKLPPGLEVLGDNEPPGFLIPIYRQAAQRYHVPWQVLAAINQVETDYGRNLSTSSAGAVGWMQFMPETWRQWALDADRDGQLNPYSPMDAIFTAARYLQANGAARDLPAAIFAYNHANWYVAEVLLRAHALEHDLVSTGSESGYSLPLDRQYMAQLGRTDDGVDIETAPDGALVYSITPGVVSAVASDPSGFGPDYPVIQATGGSLAGQNIYYGHVAEALVQPGERVSAGQPIAIMGHTGDASSLGHGHIEIGFSDAGGDPLNHHGAAAWTPSGEIMRSFLVTLCGALHVQRARSSGGLPQ
jgi:murein DD-endopeptidase MepM/ murein hydrolase activator NlpD